MRRTGEVEEHLDLSVFGLNSDTKQHVSWVSGDLKLGDTIEIEVVTGEFDPPSHLSEKPTEEDILKQKLENYHRLKVELKAHFDAVNVKYGK